LNLALDIPHSALQLETNYGNDNDNDSRFAENDNYHESDH